MARAHRIVVVGLGIIAAGCVTRSSTPSSHRTMATECARQRVPGRPQPQNGTCRSDADCRDGNNGRCSPHGGGRLAPTNQCTYDGCFTDADCGKGVCNCTHDATTLEDWSGGHWCSPPGNCQIDADCGEGGFCSPTYPLCGRGGAAGHYCHTWRDECRRDEDCRKKEIPNWSYVTTQCIYSGPSGRWVCASEGCPIG